jgi:hypothetical protein
MKPLPFEAFFWWSDFSNYWGSRFQLCFRITFEHLPHVFLEIFLGFLKFWNLFCGIEQNCRQRMENSLKSFNTLSLLEGNVMNLIVFLILTLCYSYNIWMTSNNLNEKKFGVEWNISLDLWPISFYVSLKQILDLCSLLLGKAVFLRHSILDLKSLNYLHVSS